MIRNLNQDYCGDVYLLAKRTKVFTTQELSCLTDDLVEIVEGKAGRDNILVYINESTKEVLGFIHYGPAPITVGSWYIWWVGVDPDAQGQGIGKKLIEAAEAKIRAKRGRLVYIETSAQQSKFKPARALYVKCKYEVAGTFKDYYKPGDAKVIYVKNLRKG